MVGVNSTMGGAPPVIGACLAASGSPASGPDHDHIEVETAQLCVADYSRISPVCWRQSALSISRERPPPPLHEVDD